MGNGRGMGMGRGAGQGERPEEEHETRAIDSQIKPKIGKGVAVVVGDAGGANYKGKVAEQINDDYETARRGQTSPLTSQRIPKKRQQHAEEYFNRFREGR